MISEKERFVFSLRWLIVWQSLRIHDPDIIEVPLGRNPDGGRKTS